MESRPVALHALPHRVLFNIVFKMENKQVCRMRRTCRKIDSLVEKNKEKYSSRVGLGSSVIFHVETTSDQLRYGLSGRRTLYNIVDETFEKRTSGIAFSAIYFSYLDEKNRDIRFPSLIEAMARLRPICNCVTFTGIHTSDIISLFEFIQCQKEFVVEGSRSTIELEMLSRANCSSQLSVSFAKDRKDPNGGGPFLLMKNFRNVKRRFPNSSIFASFLNEMYNSSDSGNLRSVCCVFRPYIRIFEESERFPPLETLWESNDDSCGCITMDPKGIFLMEMNGRNALLVEHRGPCAQQTDIYFIEKEPTATLEAVLHHLDLTSFSDEQKKDYLHADKEEQRRKILMEAFVRQNQEENHNELID